VLSLLCFGVGGLLGWSATRGGGRLQRVWPVVLRAQILLTSATLSLFAAWRLTTLNQLVGPLVLAGGLWVLFVVAIVTRGERSTGEGALESWAVGPNSGFWVVPVATAFAGSSGAMIAVLANAANAAQNAVCVHLMRRDAPIRQRRSTTWVDQSPVLALAVGLLLHLGGRAPASSKDVLTLAGPLLAFSGAALFAGSVVHPHNLSVTTVARERRRWLRLTVLRVAYFMAIVVATSSPPLAVVAAVSALSAPSFNPIQQAVLYGYRSGVVNVAVRWSWPLAPVGLGVAAAIRWA
jgi:hypothetical protein